MRRRWRERIKNSPVVGVRAERDNGSIPYNIVGMDRHGVIAVDTSPWRAFEHIERLEHICKIVLTAG